MTSIAPFPQAPAIRDIIAVTRPASARRGQRRGWLIALLAMVLLIPALLVLPPVWRGTVRIVLTWQASRDGYELTINRISGGIFDVTHFEGMRLRRRGTGMEIPGGGTDLNIDRARFAVAWHLPWKQRSASWFKEIHLEGVSGRLDFTAEATSAGTLQHRVSDAVSRPLPADFVLQADNLQVCQGKYSVRMSKFLLTGKPDATGEIAVEEMRAEGPGLACAFPPWHGQTFWKGDRLTLVGLDLGNGISLASATLDASQIGRRRLGWDCALNVAGGEVRGQGAVDFAGRTPMVEIAATLQRIPLAPFARTVGIHGPIDGQVEQASFTFHGDPENLATAQMWWSIRATELQWGNRRWDSLDTQAVVVNRRVEIHRFDLRQLGNRLALSGADH